jgi:hypothetical protein
VTSRKTRLRLGGHYRSGTTESFAGGLLSVGRGTDYAQEVLIGAPLGRPCAAGTSHSQRANKPFFVGEVSATLGGGTAA